MHAAQCKRSVQAWRGLLYGLQYDIDSTRLVGLYTNQFSGRLRTDLPWTYKLATILINTTNKDISTTLFKR